MRTEKRLDAVVREKLEDLLATVGTRTDRVQKYVERKEMQAVGIDYLFEKTWQ